VNRIGLVATNSIRGGRNRLVLDRIAQEATIFEAWSDEPWIVDGAAVRVSLICFAKVAPGDLRLDSKIVAVINPDLSHLRADLTKVRRLLENESTAFNGIQKTGPFEIPAQVAREWLTQPRNPNGRPNSDVLQPYWNGLDVPVGPEIAGSWISARARARKKRHYTPRPLLTPK